MVPQHKDASGAGACAAPVHVIDAPSLALIAPILLRGLRDRSIGVREMAVSGNPMAGDAITGRLVFRLAMYDESGNRGVRADGGPAFETEVFAWAEMSAESLEHMATSIAPHIDAPRVEVDDIGG